MQLESILESVELFEGLPSGAYRALAQLCQERTFKAGETITKQGESGDELFVICEGFVEVLRADSPHDTSPRTVVNLGRGQIFGEMALVDRGPRSASVKAVSEPTVVLVIHRDDFDQLCEENNHVGYVVMRNIAADLSFKVRHHHLASR